MKRSTLKLYRYEDAVAFHDRTQPYLLQHEAQQYVLLSFIKALIKFPERYSEPPYLAVVEEHGEIVAITVRLSSQHLVLSVIPNLLAVQLINSPDNFDRKAICRIGFK